MKRHHFVGALIVICLAYLLAEVAQAGPPGPKPPKITGGGTFQNNNSGISPAGIAQGGVIAQATGFAVGEDYPARGQIQARSVFATELGPVLTQIHGTVVCMRNLGDTVNGAAPGADVWEIRFKIRRSVIKVPPGFPPLPPLGPYGSIAVQDNGRGGIDMVDETFADSEKPLCVGPGSFTMEPMLGGNIKVH